MAWRRRSLLPSFPSSFRSLSFFATCSPDAQRAPNNNSRLHYVRRLKKKKKFTRPPHILCIAVVPFCRILELLNGEVMCSTSIGYARANRERSYSSALKPPRHMARKHISLSSSSAYNATAGRQSLSRVSFFFRSTPGSQTRPALYCLRSAVRLFHHELPMKNTYLPIFSLSPFDAH